MESLVRLLRYAEADGPTNMAADEVLLQSAAQGIASIRFYGWKSATVSLGYFQPAALHLSNSYLAALPFVRRSSGGATLVHHHELTYCLAWPPFLHDAEAWMPRMHRIITAALADLNLRVEQVNVATEKRPGTLCFQQHTIGDLVSRGSKIVGSAQRKQRQALMQHGSILLAQSEHTPELPGVRELTGRTLEVGELQDAIVRSFTGDTGWKVLEGDWTESEQARMGILAINKYRSEAWNVRR